MQKYVCFASSLHSSVFTLLGGWKCKETPLDIYEETDTTKNVEFATLGAPVVLNTWAESKTYNTRYHLLKSPVINIWPTRLRW